MGAGFLPKHTKVGRGMNILDSIFCWEQYLYARAGNFLVISILLVGKALGRGKSARFLIRVTSVAFPPYVLGKQVQWNVHQSVSDFEVYV